MEKIRNSNFVVVSPAELGARLVVRLLDERNVYLVPNKVFLLGTKVRSAAKRMGLTRCNPSVFDLLLLKSSLTSGVRLVTDMDHLSQGPWFDRGELMGGEYPPIKSGEEYCFKNDLLLFCVKEV